MTEKKESQGGRPKKKKESDVLTPEIVDKIPEELQGEFEKLGIKKGETAKIMAVMMRFSSSYRGPLPPAKEFETYEKACPGAGKRILKYMEKEQDARHTLDTKAVTGTISDTKRGQWLGFFVMISLIALAGFCIYSDKDVVGVMITFLTAGAGVCHKLIDGKSHREKPTKKEKD